jgi:tRNA-Thr(GGU) m(6)t(6)A37 methyltransferase TsaA
MKQIAHIESVYKSKFGVPRQAGLVDIEAQIVFEKEYRVVEAVRGLEEFDYVWLIWGFHLVEREGWSPTVRPPRLGGNKRMGVFATRSPFRPNPLGLSSVRLLRVDVESDNAPVLYITGADLVDGTPIYDIKPYIPYADSHPDACGGFAQQAPEKVLSVVIPDSLRQQLPDTMQATLQETISLDPRPHYQDDPQRIYSMSFDRWEVKFRVADGVAVIEDCVLNNVNGGNKKQPTASIRR